MTPAATKPTPRFFANAANFRAWLDENAAVQTELVVGFYKVGSGQPSMTWPESVDEALCHGWIDGVRTRLDDVAYKIRFTPRKTHSIWSAVNIAKFQQLSDQGRMTAAGVLAFSHRSESKSVIYAYEQKDTATLTAAEELQFKAAGAAWDCFAAAPAGYRKVVLHWVVSARRPDTRARRLAQLIEASGRDQRLR